MSYLRDYLTFATKNEAPYMYHVWCAYSVISAVASRRVWMCLDDSAIFPNLYVMLVGEPGNGKTWSLSKAKRMMIELDLPVSPSKETVEGMLRHIVGDPKAKPPLAPYGGAKHKQEYAWPSGKILPVHPYNIVASEFIDFIKTDDIGWINTLNNIYDEDFYQYRTKNMGDDYLPGPSITLLGGLPTQTFVSLQKDEIITSGLGRRTIFQYGERNLDNPHPNPVVTPVEIEARVRCIEHLEKVKSVHGQFHWTPETNLWWHDWYVPNLSGVRNKPPQVKSWYLSKSTQLMKLAMLTSLSERFDLVLEVRHFEMALDYLAQLEKDLYKIFGGTGSNQLAEVAVKIYNFLLSQKDPLKEKEIKAKFFHLFPASNINQGFNDCMNHLVDDNKILKQEMYITIGSQVSKDYIFATPEVMSNFQSVVAAAKAKQLESLNLPEKSQDSVSATGQSSLPLATPPNPVQPELQASAQSPVGIRISALPLAVKLQD